MEESFKMFAETAALLLEAVVVAIVLLGGLETIVRIVRHLALHPDPTRASARKIWARFAAWILIALEFALGADIVRTAIAPTWDDIGQLAAIAGIRTGLGFFLDRDVETLGADHGEKEQREGGPVA